MNLFSNYSLCLLAVFSTSIMGCGNHEPPPTLVVHFHNSVYDLIDHEGNTIGTANDLDEFEKLIATPPVKSLIRGKRIVARFAGIPTPEGRIPPTEVDMLAKILIRDDVNRIDLDYMDDQSP